MSATTFDNKLILSFLILFFQVICLCSASKADYFIDKPGKEVCCNEGSDVTLELDFHLRTWSSSPAKVSEFLFGVWAPPGFVKNKILAVHEHNVVLKRRGFERKVDWSGNIYDCVNCKAKIEMYNLTSADFKTYGVEVELGLDRSPLTNWLRLVKFEPAKIIKWPRRIEVEEGNATSIECKATGRPSPSVIIKTKNRTLPCKYNITGQCVYWIPAAKPVHEGEYLCLVQQRNSSQISRSLNLTVLEGRKVPTKRYIADNPTTSNTPPHNTPMTVLGTVVIVIIALLVMIVLVVIGGIVLYIYLRNKAKCNREPKPERSRIDHESIVDPCLKDEETKLTDYELIRKKLAKSSITDALV